MDSHYIHNLDPIIFSLGPLTIRWYGTLYLVGFFAGYLYLKRQYRLGRWALDSLKTQDLITYLVLGMILGARSVYVFIYNPEILSESIWNLFKVWEGGLSYHGAALGFTIAMLLFARREKVHFFHLADFVCICSGLGVFFGRLGNFVNGELYGRVTTVPWGIVFPEGGSSPRHPSQLYQAFCEGLLVFIVLVLVKKLELKRGFAPDGSGKVHVWKRTGLLASIYFILYGLGRFVVEFYRQPDTQLGYYFGWMTMGQILCSLMIIIGFGFLVYRIKKPLPIEYTTTD